MISWNIDSSTHIRPLEPKDTEDVHQLMTSNREHLDRWLRWSSGIQTQEDVSRLIALFQEKLGKGDGFHLGIWYEDELAGGVVCWYIHPENKNAEIGYWLGESFTGKGLVTRTVASTVTHLFDEMDLHRLEMQCGVANVKSRAVPERLGFTMEGVRRDSHWITNRFVDHAVYGILKHEWLS